MEKYTCLVVDDDSDAVDILTDYIKAIPQLQLLKTFHDPIAALMDSNGEETYDFIFLDIDMPGLSGIELAPLLRSKTTFLIFTTSHAKYAVDAFDIQADHFLLKPIGLNKFAKTIDALLKSNKVKSISKPSGDSTFFIKSDQKNKFIQISPAEIIAIEGLKNYVKVYTPTQAHVAYLTMKELESALQATDNFIRVHKSFIISKTYIEKVNGKSIIMEGKLEVPIGDTYRDTFYQYVTGKVLLSSRTHTTGE